jgi:exopolysaccharide production protein ExoQ
MELEKQRTIARWEIRLIMLMLFLAINFAVLPAGFNWNVTMEDAANLSQGSFIFQMQWASIFALTTYIGFRHRIRLISDLRVLNPFLLIIFIYSLITVLWSPLPIPTLKRAIQFGGLIFFSLAIYTSRRPWTDFILIILGALTVIEIASVIAAIAFPSQGIDAYFGSAWKGILDGKNSFGGVGSLSLLFWVSIGHLPFIKFYIYWSGIALSALCVLKSTSSTSITISILGVLIFFSLQKQHIRSHQWLQRILIVIALILLIFFHVFYITEGRAPSGAELLGPFASLFGKSSDLTGRSEIWEALIPVIQDHWIFGVGYNAFWFGPGSAAQPVLNKLTWIPFQAHNGYLDTINELGLVGFSIFLALIFFNVSKLTELIRLDRPAAALFTALPVTILFSNYTETTMFRGVSFQFNLLIFSIVSVSSILNQYSRIKEYKIIDNFEK